MEYNFDNKLREALMKGTNKSASQKEEVWKSIEERLKLGKERDIIMDSSGRKRIKKVAGVAVAAVVMVSTFFAVTQPGQATVGKIRDLFAPQKRIVENIEGMPENKEVKLQDSEMGYVIYIDEELYTMEKDNRVDRIVPRNKAENLPAVFMEISQVVDKAPESVVVEIEEQLAGDFGSEIEISEVDSPVKGILLKGRTGNNWNDTVVNYYLVDNTRGGTFIIKQQYFLEAAEGHGARFYYMLNEFKVVEQEK